MNRPFQIRYDRASDVVYIMTDRYGAAYGEEEESPGLIWRYLDADDSLVGLTIMDFSTYWKPRLPQLAKEFSQHFHVPARQAKKVIESVE